MSFENIPHEMRVFPQWVVWRLEDVSAAKPTKVPYNALTGRLASVSNPETWTTFDQALHAVQSSNLYTGLGFVLTESDPYAFLDLDDTKGDSVAFDRQKQIYEEFNSFTEFSPSGNGLHIIVKGNLPSGRRRSFIEIYTSGRYMTMTGNVYRDAPIQERNDLLNVLWGQMANGGNAAAIYEGSAEATETDDVVVDRATRAANGGKFNDLYTGNWQDHYPSQSEADLAIVDIIAFYSQNKAQIKRIFRASELGKRDKGQREDYVEYMLNKCFDRMLPPVDIDGLQNQLDEAIAKRQKKDLEEAQSLTNRLETKEEFEKIEIEPTNDVYSVPPGLVGEIAQFIFSASPRPVPEIALVGAIGMISGIVGRAYNISGTGLNQYTLLLASTGTGKEGIASGIDRLFNEVLKTVPACSEFRGPSEIASAQAVVKYMSRGPKSFVSLVGEFGIYLQQMASLNAPPHLIGLRRFLLDVYMKSGEGKQLGEVIYSDKDKNVDSIASPSFSILGESTPEKFYEGLHEGLISEGLLPRFTIIEYKGKRPPLNKAHTKAKPSFDLIERLSCLCAHALTLNSQDKAINVLYTSEAEVIFDQFNEHCDLQINGCDREVSKQLWNRAHLKALRLSATVAVGCNPYDPKITAEQATWAINIIVADVKNLLDRFNAGEIGVDNDEMKQLTQLIKTIKSFVVSPWREVSKYAGEGFSELHNDRIIPYSFIQRKLASVAIFRKDRIGSSNAIKKALSTLIERGDLQEVSRATLSKDYNKTARAFMISNVEGFGL